MAYEEICYEKSFLKEVIARIDFVAPPEGLDKALPSKLAKVLSEHFPISEPIDAIARQVRLTPGEVKQSEQRFKQWNFYGKEREKQLQLAAPYVFVRYEVYTTFEDMKGQVESVVDAVGKTFPDIRAARFGLRYINVIEPPDLAIPTSWGKYVAAEALGTMAFFTQPELLTRLMHIAELKYTELNLDVRFQFGMPNPDYPAIIKRPQFVLDFDAYVQSAHDLRDSLQYMEQAHERIQALFESSITDQLRELMNARPAVPIQ